jgi:excisionase family DNA binding protein
MNNSATCTTNEAVEILGVHPKKVAKLVRAGLLTGHLEQYKSRGRFVLDRASVLALAAERAERDAIGVSVSEAARILGVSHKYVQERAASGELGTIGDKRGNGRGFLVSRADVMAFLALREESEGQCGVLRQVIAKAARENRLGLEDLSLSRERDPYRLDTPAEHRNGKWLKEQIDQFVPPNKTIHLRGLFYAIVASGRITKPDGAVFVNDYANYEFLKNAAEPARWLGYVAFERIHDERNEAPEVFTENNNWGSSIHLGCLGTEAPTFDGAMPCFMVNGGMVAQPFRICLIGEKSSLRDILLPIAARVKGELVLPSGDLSNTLLSDIESRAASDGRPLVVLYFSDFDPSGYNMPPSVARKLQALRTLRGHDALQIQVHAVALTYEQVSRLDLPSTMLKETESRAGAWMAAWNHEQTEVDALAQLQPDVLRQIALDAIKPFFDETLDSRRSEAANRYRQQVKAELEASPEYEGVKAEIEICLDLINEAINELKAAQQDGIERLNMTPVAQFDSPQPEISAEAPEPIFTTDDDFVTATLKLKRLRRYELD